MARSSGATRRAVVGAALDGARAAMAAAVSPDADDVGRRYHVLAVTWRPIPIFRDYARQFDRGGADLRRLNSGRAPVCLIHDVYEWSATVGHVVADSAQATDKGLELDVELLPDDEMPAGLLARLDVGVHNVSINARIHDHELLDTEMGMLAIARQWEPEEISLVPVGACRDARLEV